MYSGIVIALLCLLLFIFLAISKRDMLMKIFSINVNASANQFQKELEQTANIIIKNLEDKVSVLEYLLEEANEKIELLDEKIQRAEKVSVLPKDNYEDSEPELMEEAIPSEVIFGEDVKQENVTDKKRLILDMAKQGCSLTEIAKVTGMGKSAIMLVLQINNK